LHIGLDGDVGTDEQGILAKPIGQCLSCFLTAGRNHHPGPFGDKELHRSSPHSTVATGDNRHFSRKSAFFVCHCLIPWIQLVSATLAAGKR
jgi:hypothetical protein